MKGTPPSGTCGLNGPGHAGRAPAAGRGPAGCRPGSARHRRGRPRLRCRLGGVGDRHGQSRRSGLTANEIGPFAAAAIDVNVAFNEVTIASCWATATSRVATRVRPFPSANHNPADLDQSGFRLGVDLLNCLVATRHSTPDCDCVTNRVGERRTKWHEKMAERRYSTMCHDFYCVGF